MKKLTIIIIGIIAVLGIVVIAKTIMFFHSEIVNVWIKVGKLMKVEIIVLRLPNLCRWI